MTGSVSFATLCFVLGLLVAGAFLLAARPGRHRSHGRADVQRDSNATESTTILDRMERIRDAGKKWDRRSGAE